MPTKKSIPPKAGAKGEGAPRDYSRVWKALGFGFTSDSDKERIAEECPFCGKERKLYLNSEEGLYNCKVCGESGNTTTFLTWLVKDCLGKTSDDDYRKLKEKRGVPLQTLKRHEVALLPATGEWLIPFRNKKGLVKNVQRYNLKTGRKFNLPVLKAYLYGLDNLSADRKKIVFLCEGPWDAIALDYHLDLKRNKYDIVAVPTSFKDEWAEFLQGRKVRGLFDNDKGGEQHRERVRKLLAETRVTAELCLLRWPEGFPEGCDINDLVRDAELAERVGSIVGWSAEHCVPVTPEPRLVFQHGRRAAEDEKPVEWVWPNRLQTGTYCSFSGRQGTFKSTIAIEVAARYSRGAPMPLEKKASLPPGHVLYIYAEDDRDSVEKRFESYGGDFDNLTTMPAHLRDDDPLNVLEHLREIEELVRAKGTRLVVIDGQNSVVGAPNIMTDMLARVNVSNKLHRFAQRLNVCLVGIRNEDAEGRALGPQSFGDIGRCVLRAVELEPKGNPPYCRLEFVKVSNAPRAEYPPIPYSVKDDGGLPRVLWGKVRPNPVKDALQAARQAKGAKG